jgi:uncharacterized protein (DUF1786 family)
MVMPASTQIIARKRYGKLGFEEVFKYRGHGAYIMEAPGFEQTGFKQVRSLIVTGPRRQMLQELTEPEIRKEISNKLHFAAPFGSMMLSGYFGLLVGFLKKYPELSINLINH